MKDKIKDIIIRVEMTTIEPEEAVNKLFDLFVVVKSLKVKDLMTFEDYKNNLFIKSDGVYQPKKTKLFRWYSEKQLKKMYKDKPL